MLTILNILKLINTQNPGCQVFWPEKIECESEGILDLKQEFITISNNLDENNKTFKTFSLRAPIDQIPENVFIDIKFKNIYILYSNFTRIHSNAFNNTCLYTEIFSDNIETPAKLGNSPPDYDIYKAFSSLVYLKDLSINLDSNTIHEIPDNAFDKSNHQQIYLEKVYFIGSFVISRIGNYAFHNMPSIGIIGFCVNSIQNISKHAFEFQFSSDVSLKIDLSGTQLDENCLESGVFQSSLRKMHLVLSIKHMNIIFRIYEEIKI
jgi:hypothetical protein